MKTPSGQPGWLCSFYNVDENGHTIGDRIADFVLNDTRVKLNDFLPKGLKEQWVLKLTGTMTVDKTMPFELGLTVAGKFHLKLFMSAYSQ